MHHLVIIYEGESDDKIGIAGLVELLKLNNQNLGDMKSFILPTIYAKRDDASCAQARASNWYKLIILYSILPASFQRERASIPNQKLSIGNIDQCAIPAVHYFNNCHFMI